MGRRNPQAFNWTEMARLLELSRLEFSATMLSHQALTRPLSVVVFIPSCSVELGRWLVPMNIQYTDRPKFQLRPNHDAWWVPDPFALCSWRDSRLLTERLTCFPFLNTCHGASSVVILQPLPHPEFCALSWGVGMGVPWGRSWFYVDAKAQSLRLRGTTPVAKMHTNQLQPFSFSSVKNNLCMKVSTCVMAEAVPKCFSCKMFNYIRHGHEGDTLGVGLLLTCLSVFWIEFVRMSHEGSRGQNEGLWLLTKGHILTDCQPWKSKLKPILRTKEPWIERVDRNTT